MKKFIASAGIIAVGAAGLHAENVAGLTPQQTTKPWSVSAALRGFYDDNYATQPNAFKQGSTGVELSPTLGWNMPGETTYIGLSYTYGIKHYFDRVGEKNDQSHDVTAKVDHRFSNRYSISFTDSFIYAREPELIDGSRATAIRTDANAERNRAGLQLEGALTETLGFEAAYQNLWYNYLDSGAGSRSALLNRFENLVRLDGRWQFQEHAIGVVGYNFGNVSYTSSESIFAGPVFVDSSERDNTSHSFYLGGDYNLSSRFQLSGRAGVRYTDYQSGSDSDGFSPYFDFSGSYNYLPGSSLRAGFRHDRSATDQVGTATDVTQDQAITTVYSEWTHRITPSISGSLLASFQNGAFNGGTYDGASQNFYLVGLAFNYRINQYWSVETGYNWDRLVSDVPGQTFTRNRLYLGVRAAY